MLWLLTDFEDPSMRVKERWEFIKLTRHAFGRTALVLSGGGALGAFHLVRDIQALCFICPPEYPQVRLQGGSRMTVACN